MNQFEHDQNIYILYSIQFRYFDILIIFAHNIIGYQIHFVLFAHVSESCSLSNYISNY